MSEKIGVAEAKKRFSELVGRAAYAGEHFIVARRGKPMAAIIGIEDLEKLEVVKESEGLLGAVGAWAEYENLDEVIAEIYKAREGTKGRKVKLEK